MHAYKTAYTDDWLHFEPISRILDIRHKIVLNIFLFLFNKKIIHSKSLVATIYWKAIGREGEYLKLMLLMSAHLSKRMPKKMSFFWDWFQIETVRSFSHIWHRYSFPYDLQNNFVADYTGMEKSDLLV